jgi:hypothetical protein
VHVRGPAGEQIVDVALAVTNDGDPDFLLAVDDASRVGELRFKDEDGVFQRAAEEGRRTPTTQAADRLGEPCQVDGSEHERFETSVNNSGVKPLQESLETADSVGFVLSN